MNPPHSIFSIPKLLLPLAMMALLLSNPMDALAANISGTIFLPTGAQSNGNTRVELTIVENDSQGNFLNFTTDRFPLANGESQTAYSLDYPTPAVGNQIELTFSCTGSCEVVDFSQATRFFLQDNGDFDDVQNSVDAASIPQSVNFQFPDFQVNTLSGTISVPSPISDGGFSLPNIFVAEVDALGNMVRQAFDDAVLELGVGEVAYSIDYLAPDSGNELQISFRCSSNCLDIDFNQFREFFLQDDGSFSDTPNSIEISNVPSELDFEFPEPPITTLTGNINLPTDVLSDGGTSIDITIEERSPFNELVRSSDTSVDVPNGANQAPYTLTYLIPEPGNQLSIKFTCSADCRSVDFDQAALFFLQDDGGFSREMNTVSMANTPNTLDFQFPDLQLNTLSGVVSLPTDVLSNGDTSVLIRIQEGGFFNGNIVTILEPVPLGQNQINYSVEYLTPVPDSQTSVEFRCSGQCSEVDASESRIFYLQDDGSLDHKNNTVSVTNLPAVLYFQFPDIELAVLTGMVTLPSSVVSDGNLSVRVVISERDSHDNFIRQRQTFLDFPNGSNEQSYFLPYIVPELGNQVFLSFTCSGACNDIDLNEGRDFFLQQDGSFIDSENPIDPSALLAGINFQFPVLRFSQLSGRINLPNGVISDGSIATQVFIEEIGSSGLFIRRTELTESIPSGQNGADYSLSYISPRPDSRLRLGFRCSTNCSEVSFSQFSTLYLQNDGSIGSSASRIEVAQFPSSVGLAFPEFEVRNLSGVIMLPAGVNSQGNTFIRLTISETNSSGTIIQNAIESFLLASGDNQIAYSLDYLLPDQQNRISIQFDCVAECQDISLIGRVPFILQDNGTFNQTPNSVPPSLAPPVLNFQFPELQFNNISGVISLPPGVVSNGSTRVFIRVAEPDTRFDRGKFLGGRSIIFESGNNQTPFSVDYLSAAADKETSITFTCLSDCGDIDLNQTRRHYLQGDGSINRAVNTLAEGAIPSTANVQFPTIQLSTLTGQISLPDGIVSDGTTAVSVRLFESLGPNGGSGSSSEFVRFPIDSSTVNYSLEFLTPAEGNPLNLSFECSISCEDISAGFNTSFNYQEDGSFTDSFTSVDSAMLLEVINFQFPEVTRLTSTVQRSEENTEKDLATFVTLIEVDDQGRIVRSINEQSQRGDILSGETTRAFEISTSFFDPTASYILQYGCGNSFSGSENCGNLLRFIYVGGDGAPIVSFEQAALSPIAGSDLETILSTPLELLEGRPIDISIARPADDPSPALGFFSEITVEILDENSNVVDTQTLRPLVAAGFPATVGSFAIANAPPNGNYRITLGCAPDFFSPCFSFVQNNPAYTVVVDPEALPSPVELQFILPFSPDRFEEDDSPERARPVGPDNQQIRSIHDEGDEDWIKFSVEEPGEVNLITTSLSEDISSLELALFDDNLNALATDQDAVSEAEASDNKVLSIDLDTLEAGEYFLRMRAISPINILDSYSLLLLGVARLNDELCFPVQTTNGATGLICL